MEVPTKTAADWRVEIGDLDQERTEREEVIEAKKQERQSLSLPAVRGDVAAIKKVKTLTEQIEQAEWQNHIAGLAIIEANRHMTAAVRAENDAVLNAILAERDAVEVELAGVRKQIARVLDTLVDLKKESRRKIHYLTKLSGDAGQEHAGKNYLKVETNRIDGYIRLVLNEVGVDGIQRPMVGQHRAELRAAFGADEVAEQGES